VHPWRLDESKKVVDEEYQMDGLIDKKVMPGLGHIARKVEAYN